MESLIEFLSFAYQFLGVDSCPDIVGSFDQTLVFGVSCLMAMVHSDPLGYVTLAHLNNPYLIGLDRIFLPIETFSAAPHRYSAYRLNIFATAKRSIVPSALSCHMNC